VDVLNRGRPAGAAEKTGAKPAPKGGEAKADAKTEKQAEKK
jgi:hypothetical protein